MPTCCCSAGVLAFNEKEWANAAGEFEKSWQKDPTSFPAAYNLMLTRLCQGQLEGAVEMLDKLLPLAHRRARTAF